MKNTQTNMQVWKQRLFYVVVILYAVFLTVATVKTGSKFCGEAASYMLTTVSLANDGNAIVSQEEIELAQKWFPQYAENYEGFQGSHYTTSQGIVPWYFATYPAACLPMLGLLALLELPLHYAFCLTNLVCMLLMLAVAAFEPRLKLSQRMALCLMLGVHPAIFYINWSSAEVFQFACIAIAAIWWAAGRKHLAALLIAVAGTTNPCILAIGLAMIGEYLVSVWKETTGRAGQRVKQFVARWKEIILYGCCYLPGLVPFAYNYSICGAINLTASYGQEWIPLDDGTIFRHLWAYFTDWNFGILPYMPILLIVWVVLLVLAVAKRCTRYLWMSAGFLGAMLGYSFMANINCGMDGIARYNAWSTALMTVAVCTQWKDLMQGILPKRILAGALACSAVYTGGVIVAYGGIGAPNGNYLRPTPIAQELLQYIPQLYTPLESTLHGRSNTPIWIPCEGFLDSNLDLRKLYMDQSQAEALMSVVGSQDPEDMVWLNERLSELGEEKEVVTIPANRHIYLAKWSLSPQNGYLYVVNGKVEDGILVTEPVSGYPFLGETEPWMPGTYTVTLNASCVEMPQDMPAQLQVGIKTEDGYQILAYTSLQADGTAQITLELTEKAENVSCRVYQNEGTVLKIESIDIVRN